MVRIAVIGAGFWSGFQTRAWGEVEGAEVVGVADLSLERARALHPVAYDDARRMIRELKPDLVDVVSPPEAHREHVLLCAELDVDCVCQKPLAPAFADAEEMVHGHPRLWVHENFRFQAPLVRLAEVVASGVVGEVFRARLSFVSGFEVWRNQPALATAERFLLADVGVHVVDVARAVFGEATLTDAWTMRTRPGIVGETAASLILACERCPRVAVELAYAAPPVRESFPETLALVEGDRGTIGLAAGGALSVATASGVVTEVVPSPGYAWVDPAYGVVHASIVACHRAILADRAGGARSGVRGVENLRTLALIEAAYQRAAA